MGHMGLIGVLGVLGSHGYDADMTSAELASLTADYPEWQFLATYIESSSGPGGRMILAKRLKDGVLVGGLNQFEVRQEIRRQDEVRDEPPSTPPQDARCLRSLPS